MELSSFLIFTLIAVLAVVCLVTAILLTRSGKAGAGKYKDKLDHLLAKIRNLHERKTCLMDFDSGYLMKRDWDAIASETEELQAEVLQVPFWFRMSHQYSKTLKSFLDVHIVDLNRKNRNSAYVQHEAKICDSLLSSVDGKSLDDQQRLAIFTDEYSNLIIAGAGSGKTLTVVGKIKYLVDRRGIDPERILVTSFTRKSVSELTERIERAGIKNVRCKTFHSIGFSQLDDVALANEKTLENCIREYLKSCVVKESKQIQSFLEFYGCFAHIPKDYAEYTADGQRMEALKAVDLKTIKGKLDEVAFSKLKRLDTLRDERVRSLEELTIANYLFIHGINYEYEKKYTGDIGEGSKKYQPDFYLVDYDIWFEHFGVNEHGRAPWIENAFEEQRYIEGIKWKRDIHASNKTTLIESYSYWNKDHDLINKLERLLRDNGVYIDEDLERLETLYNELKQDGKYLVGIVKLISSFLSLAKANNIEMEAVWELGRVHYAEDGYMWHRFELFMTFASPIMSYYRDTLKSRGEIDFDDMINMATDRIQKDGIVSSYDYIIVDEYQDISKSRFGLIRAIREKTDAKLICVGDDWQAIYRFAGSDVTLFTHFDKYVGFHETLRIETTYRNSQELVDVASRFIEKNPAQIKKALKAVKQTEQPLIVFSSNNMREDFERVLDAILASQESYAGHILVLGRHNFDLSNLYPNYADTDSVKFTEDRGTREVKLSYRGYRNISFLSVHKAKGLEADDVIVLNLVNDKYGFPNQLEDDPILELLLDNEESFEFAEERRLFYVAITRTKNFTYMITDSILKGRMSPFVEEIRTEEAVAFFVDEDEDDPVKCPRCGTGNLIVRTNALTGKTFLGCSNFPHCDKKYGDIKILQDKIKCPRCGGWMVRRKKGSDGTPFFGCSNFPDGCKATMNIDSGCTDYAVTPF